MKTRYYLPQYFQEEFEALKNRKENFIYERTSYTRKLKTDSFTIFFTPDGRSTDGVLSLINKVRNSAKKYMSEHNTSLPDSKIFFLDLFNIPKSDDIITKVDITSAYWKQAIMDGIIDEDINQYMLNLKASEWNLVTKSFDERPYTSKELKGIRLKALGSLATRKEVEIYEKGIAIHWEIIEQQTKEIYMNICRSIDQMMRKCRTEVDECIFYYWDCMFVKKRFSNQVIDFFQNKNFECKTEDTNLSYDLIGTKGYLTSEVDGKMYLVSSENRNLLKEI